MPFDGSEYPISKALEKMDRVITLLSKPDRWCKGTERTADGRHCIVGALRAYEAQRLLQPAIMQAIAEVTGRHSAVQEFNDRLSTSHDLIVEVLHRARDNIATGRQALPAERRRRAAKWKVLMGLSTPADA